MGDVLLQQKAVQSPRPGTALSRPPCPGVKSKGHLTSSLIQTNTTQFPKRCKNLRLPAQVLIWPPASQDWFMSGQ